MNLSGILLDFCDETGADPEEVAKRWKGHPERIIEDVFRIPDERGDLHPVELFQPWQAQFVRAYFYGDATTLTLVKGRRIGGTAVALMSMLLEGITMPGQLYPLVSTEEGQAISRISDLQKLIDNAVIEIPCNANYKKYIELWNGTKFKAYTGSPKSLRGDGARSILFDEMAFMDDQTGMLRAARPMMGLSSGKRVQVSTVNSPSDEFMKSYSRGTKSGFDKDGKKVGTIALFQPTFFNYEEIDIERSLYEQELEPARPDLNIDIVEEDRAADPMGFQQEYLCIPAATEYLFFDVGLLKNAARPGEYQYGWGVGPLAGGEMWMAVDVGIKHDDTVIAVCEHVEQDRYLRYIEVVDENSLRASGIPDPDRSNINHIVRRIGDVFRANQCDRVILDATGNGEWFPVQVAREVSGSMIPFNFSDTKATRDMFLGMNLGLHNGNVYLPDDEQLFAQLASITRIQKEDRHVPKFSGKEHAPDGKDDMAIATVMACYPPGFNHGAEPSVAGKEWDKHEHYPAADDQGHLFAPAVRSGGGAGSTRAAFSGKINRSSGRRKYRSRYAR